VAATEHDDRAEPMLGGGLLSNRIRASHDGFEPQVEPDPEPRPAGTHVTLGAAMHVEIESGHVSFLVPFAGQWPVEYWLHAFRQAQVVWPSHLDEPRLDEGRGLQLGPVPAHELEQHVRALKERVAAANRIYAEEIEPELRRQREEALRREEEERRIQADVESKLKLLLG
jgi:hypothetical protein